MTHKLPRKKRFLKTRINQLPISCFIIMTKSYTLTEIHQNRLRIKSIPKNLKFLEVYKICVSFGELMFFDVLACVRPLVYASFVNRHDAFAALQKINAETLMEASFSNESSNKYLNDEIFVLDLQFLDECEKERLFKRKQIRVRSRKNPNFKTKQFEKNFDIYPDFYSTDSNSEVLVNDEEIKQLMTNEHKLVSSLSNLDLSELNTDSLSEFGSADSLVASSSSQPSSLEFVGTNEEYDDEDEELTPIDYSLTSWSVFNGKPKDWSKFRLPRSTCISHFFPSLKEKTF